MSSLLVCFVVLVLTKRRSVLDGKFISVKAVKLGLKLALSCEDRVTTY